jgi:hypothetical protein
LSPSSAPTTLTPSSAPSTLAPTSVPTTLAPTSAPTTLAPSSAPTTTSSGFSFVCPAHYTLSARDAPVVSCGAAGHYMADMTASVYTGAAPRCVANLAYAWATSEFGACSNVCGGGEQTRSVVCRVATEGGVAVANGGVTTNTTLCAGAAPDRTQACNTAACATGWQLRLMTPCSKTCNGQSDGHASHLAPQYPCHLTHSLPRQTTLHSLSDGRNRHIRLRVRDSRSENRG